MLPHQRLRLLHFGLSIRKFNTCRRRQWRNLCKIPQSSPTEDFTLPFMLCPHTTIKASSNKQGKKTERGRDQQLLHKKERGKNKAKNKESESFSQ
jgi:hypothetical protein